MNQPDQISAAMLQNGSVGLAGYAASDLLQSQPDLKQTLATQAFATWQVVLRNCGIVDPLRIEDYVARDGYQALAKVLTENDPDKVIETSGAAAR